MVNKRKYKNKVYDRQSVQVKKGKERQGKTLTETITPNYNKNVRYQFITRGKGGKLYTGVSVLGEKNSKRFLLNFKSKNLKDLAAKKKNIIKNKNPTTTISKNESYTFIGTKTENNVDLWKVQRTTSVKKGSDIGGISRNQQIWVRAEVSVIKKGQTKLLSFDKNRKGETKYFQVIYGYSKMGGTEEQALKHVYAQILNNPKVNYADQINVDITGKGVISFDR